LIEEYCKDINHYFRSPNILQENLDVLERYWEEEYAYRELVDQNAAYNELKRSLEVLGSISILTGSRQQIQKQLDETLYGGKHGRVVSKLRQIIKFLNRDVKLRKKKTELETVRYLSEEEFHKILPYIPGEVEKSLVALAFYSGLRIGECFACTVNNLRRNKIILKQQMREDGTIGQTKTRRIRKTFLWPAGRKYLERWSELSLEERKKHRRRKWAVMVGDACRKAFPNDLEKRNIVFHDLRHSYAIHLLNRGIEMSIVSQALGPSISVVNRYYAGFELTDPGIDRIEQIIEKNMNKDNEKSIIQHSLQSSFNINSKQPAAPNMGLKS